MNVGHLAHFAGLFDGESTASCALKLKLQRGSGGQRRPRDPWECSWRQAHIGKFSPPTEVQYACSAPNNFLIDSSDVAGSPGYPMKRNRTRLSILSPGFWSFHHLPTTSRGGHVQVWSFRPRRASAKLFPDVPLFYVRNCQVRAFSARDACIL